MKKILPLLLVAIFAATSVTASEKSDSSKIYFENAFTELKSLLEGKIPANFERAVFVSENPFWNNQYSFESFKRTIDEHLYFIENIIATNDRSDTMNFSAHVMSNGKFKMDDIRYLPKEKKELYLNALKNWAIFKYITDTIIVAPFYHLPISYASNDPFGRKNWASSQVLNLLASKEPRGNCFALAGLFKILSDRLNSKSSICTAPQHIYIQHRDHKGDFYNIELATAGHPGDGKIQTLTYTTNEAIMSGIALREYNDKESIGLCLVNLAKSYEHKFNSKGNEFILKCAELALKHDSLNLNALLLKQQVLDERTINYAVKNKINDINRIKTDKAISGTYFHLQKHLLKLYTLGYRQMPLYMQQMILDGFSNEKTGSISAAKNPSPFTTVKPKDPKDEQYWTLSHGAFQEVFVPKKFETYGHFTLNTEAKTISSIDTTEQKGFLIDPVAFAYDFGARMYDARLGIFISVDPLAHKMPGWSPYAAFNNNPILNIDNDGKYAVSVHYNITYNTLIKLGYSKSIADNVAHHASVYADHPPSPLLLLDNAAHGTSHSYKAGIDYSKTQFSQEEWRSNWHSMMSDAEAASGMTHEQAMQRGLAFGWSNIFSQQEKEDIGKLGQGLHALQDAYAHKGASTDEHLGLNMSSAKMFQNDMYGDTKQAELITQSAGILLQLFKGNTNSLQNGMSLDFTGLSSEQLKTTQGLFGNAGYNLNAGKETGIYTLKKIEK